MKGIPEGATHFGSINGTIAAFYKDFIAGIGFKLFGSEKGIWVEQAGWPSYAVSPISQHPEFMQPWTGDGLPPVGTVCEHDPSTLGQTKWQKVTVVAHHLFDGELCAVWAQDTTVSWSPADLFRPLRTPEERKAYEREKAIERMLRLDECGSLSRTVFCGLLYDAGYRKQVAP